MPKLPLYSTQQLKERGWTPAMIRDLLGPHDATRPSEQRVGRRDRIIDAEVKLYRRDRVEEIEPTQAFADAQGRARAAQDAAGKAAETRRATLDQAIETYLNGYQPKLERHPDAANMTWQQLWTHHNMDSYHYEARVPAPATRSSRTDRQKINSGLLQRLHDAFKITYPEFSHAD